MKKAKIKTSALIEELKKYDEEFADECEQESPNYAMSLILSDSYFFKDISKRLKNTDFPYNFIKAYSEKGDGKDEETCYGIFQRKKDLKFFQIRVHDAGFVGPETLTMSQFLEEVRVEKKRIVKTVYI